MFDHIYLTGFKKFGNHPINPTEEIVKSIQMQGVTCTILEVTTVDVDNYINRIKQELSEHKERRVLHLHFGVGPNLVYKPESMAYNNKNFSIPDNAGYQPKNQKIDEGHSLEQPLKTTLSIEDVFQYAAEHDFAWDLSTNPGRFLCNYIYFRSLLDLSSKHTGNHSLFIHFPILAICSHEKNLRFVTHILNIFLKGYTMPKELLALPLVSFDHIYLTGFMKFSFLKFNPTEDVVNKIIEKKLPRVTCRNLDVSINDVDQYIQELLKKLPERKGQKILHLHLGVGNQDTYNIQRYAYNNKDFTGLADNKGNLPIKVKIVEDRHLDEPLGTNLNVSALKETGNKHFPLKVSADPGRYICNYIYYRSLSTISNKFEGNHSLFIHFPFSKEPIHETRDENFMMHIFEQLLTSKNLSTQ